MRGPAGWLLISLAALAPLAGCDCNSKLPVVPVVLPPLSAVVVTPGRDTLRVGEAVDFEAVAYDTAGRPFAGAGFIWSSGDPAVFSAASTGRVTGLGEGIDTVFATLGGRTGFAIVTVYRDSGWVRQVSASSRNLNGVFFQADGRRGWAVGDAGAILHTADAGAKWSLQISNAASNLNAVFFAHPDTGWVVGNGGIVLRTDNGGARWTQLTVPASENLLDVYFANSDIGWVVGSNGAVLRTVNGGRDWEKRNLPTFALNSVAFAGTRDGWAVGDVGAIFGTHDAGAIWFRVETALTTEPLKAVWRRSALAAWAVGAQGVTPRTVASAADTAVWELRNAGAFNQLSGVHFPQEPIGFAVGYSSTGAGLILRSDDGGASWVTQGAHASGRLKDVFFVDAQRGWAVGEAGTIVHTATGGLD